MKIIDKEDPLNRIVTVYAIYWATNPNIKKFGQRMQLVGPYDGYDALVVVPEESTKVIDSSIDGYRIKKMPDGGDLIVHWAVDDGDLLFRLTENDRDAVLELRRRIDTGRPLS